MSGYKIRIIITGFVWLEGPIEKLHNLTEDLVRCYNCDVQKGGIVQVEITKDSQNAKEKNTKEKTG